MSSAVWKQVRKQMGGGGVGQLLSGGAGSEQSDAGDNEVDNCGNNLEEKDVPIAQTHQKALEHTPIENVLEDEQKNDDVNVNRGKRRFDHW